MRSRRALQLAGVAVAVVGASTTSVRAQQVEALGVRALGMGGAFVAVADDVSAIYWNPAGLGQGDFFGGAVEFGRIERPRVGDAQGAGPSAGTRVAFAGVATPPLGFAYYQLHEFGRHESGTTDPLSAPGVPIARLETRHIGLTLVQTLVQGLEVGATLAYVRGSAGTGLAAPGSSSDALSARARDLATRSSGAFGLDVGVRFAARAWSVGVLARNLTRPAFSAPDGADLALDRQARIGVAIRPAEGWVVAADADLREAESLSGTWRRAAVGAERWWPGRRLGLRGGVRFETKGPARPVATAGASVALRSGLWVEGHVGQGEAQAEQAWGLDLRFAF